MTSVEDKVKVAAQEKGITLKSLAAQIGMTETGFYAMIRNRSMKVETLQKISQIVGQDVRMFFDTNNSSEAEVQTSDFYMGKTIRVLPIVVDKLEQERITFVPIKAAAGYLTRHQDMEYIGELPTFNLPNLKDGTYRAFEVEGDSMKPTIHASDIVICRYVENWFHIMDNRIYLVVGTEGIGIVVKRLINRLKKEKKLILWSENDFYPEFEMMADEIAEIWEVKVKVSTNLEPPLYLDKRMRRLEDNINNVVGMVSKVFASEKQV
jgi:transcriptional regulator with XRE-family HTH domain